MSEVPDTAFESPTDRVDLDDGFERLARGAGAALRHPAPTEKLDQIVRRGKRQRAATRVSVAGIAVVAGIAGGFVLWTYHRGDDPAPPVTTTAAPAAPWIAYTGNRPDGYGIRLIHPDGSGDRPALTGVPAGTAEHPDWSPDGRRMVFALTESAGDGSKDLWVVDIPGAAHRLVDCSADCRWADEAAWSPDGARIAFQRGKEVNGRLVSTLEVIDVRTSATTVLLTAPPTTVYLAPRWAPDGRHLVVETVRIPEDTVTADPDGDGVGVVDLDHVDGGVRMLTDLEHFAQNPDWSWSTNRISFAARSVEGASETDIFTIAPDGSDQVQVTRVAATHGVAHFPTFTPDGRRIIFAFLTDDSFSHLYKLATVAVDGSDLRTAVGTDYIVGEQPRIQSVTP